MGTKLKPWPGGTYPDDFFADGNVFNALGEGDYRPILQFITRQPSFLNYYYHGKSLLHVFAEYDFPELLDAAVKHGMDVNVEEEKQPFGPLMVAVDRGKLRSARWLLENGAKTTYQARGLTFCCGTLSAVAAGEFEMVKLLIEHGAPVDILVDDPQRSLLTTAIQFGHTEVADYLRSKGALTEDEIKARDAKGKPKRKK